MLYIHIPFCDSKCHYCAFNSYTAYHEYKESYMKAVLVQLENDIKEHNIKKNSLESIFVGGGTPSAVSFELYFDIFSFIKNYIKPNVEITFEANPNSATKEWLDGIKKLGATRVSFGVQSFNDKKLKFLGRSHSASEALKAIRSAKNCGFEHISLDLMYSTPFDKKDFLYGEFEVIKDLPIDHISMYSLMIEEKTKFANTPQVQHERDEIYEYIIKKCQELGLRQYEVSNFGKYQSKHNIGYWEYKPYLGAGAGAVGCIKNQRIYPNKDIEKYINNPTFKEYEALGKEDIKTEKILLGLRFKGGFDIDILNDDEKKRAILLEVEKKITIKDSKVYNSNFFIADEIALFIIGLE